MTSPILAAADDLPAPVARTLAEFVAALETTLGPDLRSVVLFGSAAENRLRATSDVNAIVVLAAFNRQRIDALSETLLAARAAIRLNVMWLLESEIADALQAFGVKFADVSRRHRVLWGVDPFQNIRIPREAAIARLRQVLLNLVLRLRANYALYSQREERLAVLIADAAGPLRASAAEILELEKSVRVAPREALEQLARTLPGDGWDDVLEAIGEVRQTRAVAAGTGAPLTLKLIDLAGLLLSRASALATA
jgi:hypothetical protein